MLNQEAGAAGVYAGLLYCFICCICVEQACLKYYSQYFCQYRYWHHAGRPEDVTLPLRSE